jgi:hypothetical protein
MSNPDRDEGNPSWTREDFARAKGPEALPSHVLAAFPRTSERLAREGGTPGRTDLATALRQQAMGARLDTLAA